MQRGQPLRQRDLPVLGHEGRGGRDDVVPFEQFGIASPLVQRLPSPGAQGEVGVLQQRSGDGRRKTASRASRACAGVASARAMQFRSACGTIARLRSAMITLRRFSTSLSPGPGSLCRKYGHAADRGAPCGGPGHLPGEHVECPNSGCGWIGVAVPGGRLAWLVRRRCCGTLVVASGPISAASVPPGGAPPEEPTVKSQAKSPAPGGRCRRTFDGSTNPGTSTLARARPSRWQRLRHDGFLASVYVS
jgi:hypothetical protein